MIPAYILSKVSEIGLAAATHLIGTGLDAFQKHNEHFTDSAKKETTEYVTENWKTLLKVTIEGGLNALFDHLKADAKATLTITDDLLISAVEYAIRAAISQYL